MKFNNYKRYMIKNTFIITFLFIFAIVATYIIYNKFINLREKDVDTGKMEVVFHSKDSNKINLTSFIPVTDAVGLSSKEYDFTVKNNSQEKVKYKIMLVDNLEIIKNDNCDNKIIPKELLKLSLRVDHQAPILRILSEYGDNVLFEDVLDAKEEEDYSVRIWALKNDFLIDKESHFHAIIKVIEEEF